MADAIAEPARTDAVLLEADGLVRHFSSRRGLFGRAGSAVRAVDGVDLQVRRGETLGIVGESGCGKSTLGRLLLRLIEPSAGRVRFEGEDLSQLDAAAMRKRRRAMQMIFQDPYSSLNPQMTVGAILAEPLRLHGLHRDAVDARVAALLETVGLSAAHARRHVHEFSGGQRQRVGIARALAVEPSLIVCDEAVSALDVSVQAQVVNLLMDLQQRLGIAYVFIAHDLAVVRHIATRVAVMYLGQIVEIADKDALFSRPRHPYTMALLDAVPHPVPARGARKPRTLLEGDIPNPASPPPGCRFHTRCPHVQPRCRVEAPELLPVIAPAGTSAQHQVACHFADLVHWPAAPLPQPEIAMQSAFVTQPTIAVQPTNAMQPEMQMQPTKAALAHRLQALQQAFVRDHAP